MNTEKGIKPSENKKNYWIRVSSQKIEKSKGEKYILNRIIAFLKRKGYNSVGFEINLKRRLILINKNDRNIIQLSEALIDELAQEIGIVEGKWLIHIDKESVDECW